MNRPRPSTAMLALALLAAAASASPAFRANKNPMGFGENALFNKNIICHRIIWENTERYILGEYFTNFRRRREPVI